MADQIEEVEDPTEVDDFTGEVPVHGILAPEGVPTGDGRMFAKGALTQRDLPVPLQYQFVTSHGGDTSHVATVGRVDKIWRDENDLLWWSGAVSVMKPYSDEVIAGIADRTVRGVSLDGDDAAGQKMRMEVNGMEQEVMVFTSIRTSALTIVSIPAYQEAYIAFGSDPEEGITAAAALKDCGCGEKSFTVMQDTPGPDENLPDPEDRTGALITLLPEGSDPVNDASSEDEAHLTFIWLGDTTEAEWDFEAMDAAVQGYAAGASGAITVPVRERGTLGDEDADVLFLEPTESLLAFRDGLLENETVRGAYDAAEQFDQWQPHVTLGYPEGVENGPAVGEYMGEEVTFDRIALWVGAERIEYPLGQAESADGGVFTITPEVLDRLMQGGSIQPGRWPVQISEPETESFAPGTKDGPGWITHPKPTSRIRRYWVSGEGAAKIRWGAPGDFNRCRMQLVKYVQNPDWLAGLCANMHKEALGVWPGRENGAHRAVTAAGSLGTTSPLVTLTASAAEEALVFDARLFDNPGLTGPTQMRVDTKTGRVWGHIAAWGICHIGIPNECVLAPRSSMNYSPFKTGVIDTTDGVARVAKLTYGVGHPNTRLRASRASAHYDRTDAVRAYVNVGEDSFGIWFSGVLVPGLTDRQILEFKAIGSLSGDWRLVGSNLELIAAVAVNTPGFPIPEVTFESDNQISLVSAGVVTAEDDVFSGVSDDRSARLDSLKESFRGHLVDEVTRNISRF